MANVQLPLLVFTTAENRPRNRSQGQVLSTLGAGARFHCETSGAGCQRFMEGPAAGSD